MDSDGERGLLAFEVPLCTSTPSSSVTSTRISALPNHNSQILPSFPTSSTLPISTGPMQNKAKCYVRSTSEYSRTMNHSEVGILLLSVDRDRFFDTFVFQDFNDRSGTVRSLPGHLAPQSSSTKDFVKATSSSFDHSRSNFTSNDEFARSCLMNSRTANVLQWEMPRRLSKNTRLTRPAPAPPALIGVKLKPPIPAPRRFPSLTKENKQ
ncbi:unnamed protein product, partial [Onchocerca flexuosa]|uniref:Uncharacterized protein n=1 Tax=Onchocerca flexuosa TaxID=387005 RepID=A0A183I7P7_9BILA